MWVSISTDAALWSAVHGLTASPSVLESPSMLVTSNRRQARVLLRALEPTVPVSCLPPEINVSQRTTHRDCMTFRIPVLSPHKVSRNRIDDIATASGCPAWPR